MYYCKNIEIWYLLLSLLRTSFQQSTYEGGNESNKFLTHCDPGEHNVENIDETQFDRHYRYNNDYSYPYLIESKPSNLEDREIQEYEDYREEKEMPNLSKAGLSLFSWWKSEPHAKRIKQSCTNATTVSIGITVDPAFLTATTLPSTTTVPSPKYLTACYAITEECSLLTIGSPAVCTDNNTNANNATISANYMTDSAQSLNNTTAGSQNTTIFAGNMTTTTINVNLENVTSLVTPLLNIFGAKMVLPIFQLPPVRVVNTAPPIPHNIKSSNRINYNKEPLVIKSKAYNQTTINGYASSHKNSYYNIKRLNILDFEDAGMSRITRDNPIALSVPIKSINSEIKFVNMKNKHSDLDYLNSEAYNHVNQCCLLRQINNKYQTNESQEKKFNEDGLKLKGKSVDFHNNIFNHSNLMKRKDLSDQVSLEKTFKKYPQETSIINERMNNFNVNSSIASVISSEKGNGTVQKDKSQLAENNNNFRRYVKYNDTYLSQKSNISTNLVALCKNVTCKDNDYLTQCCSRACPSGKCKDFSYLLPIPGDTTTFTSTGKAECNPICMELNTGVGSKQISMKNGKFKVNFFSIPKQSSRVVRENDISDFLKFQLMHGMTAPDGKDLMNALKAAKAQVQKVNREFRSNNARNIFQLNRNDQNLHQLTNVEKITLPKKERENFISPLNINKILVELITTKSGNFLQGNHKSNLLLENRYKNIRNQGLNDESESIKENKMILENLKKESEKELDRLSLLETRRREEEELFNKERENDLKELKTIQELIHRELESRTISDSSNGSVSGVVHPLKDQENSLKKESKYSKLVHGIENSDRNNDIDNFIFEKISAMGSNTSNSIRHNSSSNGIQKFPELEIKNSDNPQDNTLLLLNAGPKEDMLTGDQRSKREDFSNEKNKILKENMNKFVCSS